MSDQNTWRDPRPRKCGLCGSQWPSERFDLVERLIASERRAAFAERRNRAINEALDGRDMTARVAELESIIERQNETISKLNRKRAS